MIRHFEGSSTTATIGKHQFTLIPSLGPTRTLWEWRVQSGGLHLPMVGHSAWALATGGPSWWLGGEDEQGTCVGGVAIGVRPSRALPGFRILRVERFGAGVAEEAQADMLAALVHFAKVLPRVLRIHVECFAMDPDRLGRLNACARAAALRPSPAPRCYDRTLLIPLLTDDDALFAGLHSTARRHIRAAAKHPVEVRPVVDPRWVQRLGLLLEETLARTGGAPAPHDWPAILTFSRQQPELSRLVGLFRTDLEGPESLLAFAWGCCHGDHVHYSTAASTRATDLRLPLAYALVWDLMQWARRVGASVYDFGGITEGTHGGEDRLGGISDFKRYFGGAPATVGAEWYAEPSAAAARLAGLVRRLRPGR